jgi:transcriptional antiterminator NusG
MSMSMERTAEGDSGRRWYVIHTYSGYENKVKANLEKRVTSMHMEDKIFQVLVPTEEAIEFKDGKRKRVRKKIFPGYVLVEMINTDESWYVVRNTPGVTGFVSSGSRPVPLLESEVRSILRQMGLLAERPRVDLEIGQPVRVITGPFSGFPGTVEEVHPDRGKLRVLLNMFGRDTPVELDYEQVLVDE